MARDQHNVKLIFDEAAEIASPEGRAAYLEGACGGDADFRKKVEALLLALDEAGSFLEAFPDLDTTGAADTPTPGAGPGASPEPISMGSGSAVADSPGATVSLTLPPQSEGPGTTIGPYKLVQLIGEGGIGTSSWPSRRSRSGARWR